MESIAVTKIMVAPQLTPQGGVGRPLPRRGDILNYSTDFYEIWYISCWTIMKSIAITKIMVDPPSRGGRSLPCGGCSKLFDRFSWNLVHIVLEYHEINCHYKNYSRPPITHLPGGRSPSPPRSPRSGGYSKLFDRFTWNFGLYCTWMSWNQLPLQKL